MNSIQFTQIEPQQLTEEIATAVKGQLQNFFNEFKHLQPDEWLTREDVAKLLKVSISTINNWKKAEKLISYGIGNRVYFRRSEVERCLQPLKSKA